MSGGKKDMRLAALRRFATAITVFNLVGHLLFGFEQAWLHPFVALATAYAAELLLEAVEARVQARRPKFTGGFVKLVDFLLPAHITAMAVSMLLYANERVMPLVFATTVAVASKHLFRIRVGERSRHFFNPSNLGITVTLLAFPSVGIAMPYMFTENLTGAGDWLLPALIVCSGSFLNARFTKKIPLIVAWLGTFALQALVRSQVFDTPTTAPWLPMTGVAFLLFTFYMVSDPSTTPRSVRGQIAFGSSVAVVYGMLLAGHVVFTLFFALSIVCLGRGVGLYLMGLRERSAALEAPVVLPPFAPERNAVAFAAERKAVGEGRRATAAPSS
jgi:Na+-translocating ferredoxin:NAD+ oxidoreductase RnfD subunit